MQCNFQECHCSILFPKKNSCKNISQGDRAAPARTGVCAKLRVPRHPGRAHALEQGGVRHRRGLSYSYCCCFLLNEASCCCHIYSYLLLTSDLRCTGTAMSSLIINYCFQILQYYITPVNDFTDLIVTTDLSNIVSRSVFTIVAFLGRVRQRALGK